MYIYNAIIIFTKPKEVVCIRASAMAEVNQLKNNSLGLSLLQTPTHSNTITNANQNKK